MNSYYEHHLALKKNKLCPFKLGIVNNEYSVPCNWHDNIEILLCFDGEGVIQYGKDTLSFEKGDIVVINSGELHRPYSQNKLCYYFIIIDESFCRENGLDTALICFQRKFRDAETERILRHTVERTNDYNAFSQPLTAARLRAAMLELLINLVSFHSVPDVKLDEKQSPSEAYVKKVLNHLNENYSLPISLDHLASMCGITKYHLAREFKRITGQTVLTYLNALRCKKAQLLLSEGKTVTEAAFESGFESLSYFSRTYKRIMGAPPSRNHGK